MTKTRDFGLSFSKNSNCVCTVGTIGDEVWFE